MNVILRFERKQCYDPAAPEPSVIRLKGRMKYLLKTLQRSQEDMECKKRRHDTQHNDIQHNGTHHKGLICDT
jgi:hypothetical protein